MALGMSTMSGAITTLFCICVGAGGLWGCSLGDGFSDRLGAGCDTEKACAELLNDAKYRLKYCRSGAFGRVDCDEARADLVTARKVTAVKLSEQQAASAKALRPTPAPKIAEE